MVYSVLLNTINIAIKSRVKVIKLRHNKKICNLRKQDGIDKLSKTKPPKNIKHNFSSCDLTEEEIQALSHGLDQHIPSNPDRYKINTDFEYFYQNVLNDISDLPQHPLDNINPLLLNVVKWSGTLSKSCSICCKIFKVCMTILRHCEVED